MNTTPTDYATFSASTMDRSGIAARPDSATDDSFSAKPNDDRKDSFSAKPNDDKKDSFSAKPSDTQATKDEVESISHPLYQANGSKQDRRYLFDHRGQRIDVYV